MSNVGSLGGIKFWVESGCSSWFDANGEQVDGSTAKPEEDVEEEKEEEEEWEEEPE